MKNLTAAFAGILMASMISASEVKADNSYKQLRPDNPTDSRPGADKSMLGYLSWGIQSPAEFGDNGRSYSSAGLSLSMMLHIAIAYNDPADVGLEWSNFGSSYRGRDFALNNLHFQMILPLRSPLYFKWGYGLSNLLDRTAGEELTGGCWKWGFGTKLHLVNGLYATIETNRWDGPGPVGFRSQSLGMEYHF